MDTLFASPYFTLFSIVAVGIALGAARVCGVALGPAGVFFVALACGHLGMSLPRELTELGLLLFVYSVGLQAAPRFFELLRGRGAAFLCVGAGATLAGALVTVLLAWPLGLSATLASGLYCGATTCTPGLAAALEAVRRVLPEQADGASVAYGATYPFSVVAVVLLAQVLPRWLGTSPRAAAEDYASAEAAQRPELEQCVFRVENPGCAGRTIEELKSLNMFKAVICRVKRDGRVQAARPELALQMHDFVLAVGTPTELAKLEALIGGVAVESLHDPTGDVTSGEVVVSRAEAIGRALRELCLWERHGAVITRLRRNAVEFTPTGSTRLEPGDVLRVVGPREALEAITQALGRHERRLDETSLLPFAIGLAVGVGVGLIPIPVSSAMDIQLGAGGGVFLVALVLGRIGAIGPLHMHVPNAVKHFGRELGLVMFLAGAGCTAGQQFIPIVREVGATLLLVGAAVTLVTVATSVVLVSRVFRWNALFGDGALCASMTNPAALSAAVGLAESEAAAVGFASVYPVALLSKIVLSPLVFLALHALGR